jgi:vacuolar-type H+-ATPase catalytic subunit A/Vma1
MTSKFIIKLIFITAIIVTTINAYTLVHYQNDFADIGDEDDEDIPSGVVVIKDEIEVDQKLQQEIEAESQQQLIMKTLSELQKKILNLESNEEKLKNELASTKNELKRKGEVKTKVVVVKEDEKNKHEKDEHSVIKDLEGFWNVVCRVSKSLLNSFLKFFNVHL